MKKAKWRNSHGEEGKIGTTGFSIPLKWRTGVRDIQGGMGNPGCECFGEGIGRFGLVRLGFILVMGENMGHCG